MSKIRPLADYIVIRPEKAAKESPGGIVLPEAAQEKKARGTVVSVGLGRMLECGTRLEPEVAEGDTVIFAKFSGMEIDMPGKDGKDEKLKVVREHEIVCVLK